MTISAMYAPQKDSPSTVLQGDILASDTTFLVLNAAILPQIVPFPLTIGFDTSSTEVVMVTSINSVTNQLTVTRTDGRIWPAGTKVARVFNADDLLVVQQNLTDLQAQTNLINSILTNSFWQNIFINGDFSIFQRGFPNTTVSTIRKYIADRWAIKCGAGTLANITRSPYNRGGAKTKYGIEISGATGVTTVTIDQRIEACMFGQYSGLVHFSAYIYNSGLTFTPKLLISTPSAIDNWTSSTVRNGEGNGDILQNCIGSAWTKLTWSGDISNYPNVGNGVEFKIEFPSGSLVAGKVLLLTEMQLNGGSISLPFMGRPFPIELLLCQRYYEKSFNLDVTPADAIGNFSGAVAYYAHNAAFAFHQFPTTYFKVSKRVNPTIVLYNPMVNNINKIYNNDTTISHPGAPQCIGQIGFQPFVNNSPTEGELIVHYTAEAEL